MQFSTMALLSTLAASALATPGFYAGTHGTVVRRQQSTFPKADDVWTCQPGSAAGREKTPHGTCRRHNKKTGVWLGIDNTCRKAHPCLKQGTPCNPEAYQEPGANNITLPTAGWYADCS